MKDKILYVGHSFHQKTLSTKFFIDILKDNFVVDFIWTLPSSVKFELKEEIFDNNYKALIFFQVIPEVSFLKKLICKNIILIPMYDNNLKISYLEWAKYKDFKFINFSKSLYQKLDFLGLKNNLYLQYSPEIDNFYISSKKDRKKFDVFFWQRSDDINWNLVKKLLNPDFINSVHMHRIEKNEEKDKWFDKPSLEDIKQFNITFTSWFEDKEEMLSYVKNCDIFIAPRFYEGIGQAFIEAMTLGKCVIAPDLPTHNEYIQNNVNGLLYNPHDINSVDISNCIKLGENAKESMKRIRINWENNQSKIKEFIDKDIDYSNDFILKLEELKQTLPEKYTFIKDDLSAIESTTSGIISEAKTQNLLFLNFIQNLKRNVCEIKKNKKVVLYGAGTGAELLLNIISKDVNFLVDKNADNISEFMNKKVYIPEKIRNCNNIIVFVTISARDELIGNYLNKELNIPLNNVYFIDNLMKI